VPAGEVLSVPAVLEHSQVIERGAARAIVLCRLLHHD
jgi:hypothetical protein